MIETAPSLCIIIVNYKSAELTIQCLNSLEPQITPAARVIIADSNSQDGSVLKLRQEIIARNWTWASLLPLDANRGFAAGNNAAIEQVLSSSVPPEYILLLNPDTIVLENALALLLDFMQKHPKAGIIGPSLLAPDLSRQTSAFRFPSLLTELDDGLRLGLFSKWIKDHRIAIEPPSPKEPFRADWVSGACFLVRTAVLKETGLLDEHYFLYFEELDLCLQARHLGWECWCVPQSEVIHLEGESTKAENKGKRDQKRWYCSRRYYYQKNHSLLYNILTDLLWLFGYSTWQFRRIIQRKADNDPTGMLKNFLKNSFLLHPFKKVNA